MLAIGTPALIAFGAILLFLLLVVLRWALGLVGEARSLARTAATARARLREAVGEVSEQARIAAERAERVRGRRKDRPGRRRTGV